MSAPHLKFDASVPVWVRRIARRWVKRLQLHEWAIKFYVLPAEELQQRKDATTLALAIIEPPTVANRATLPQYLKAEIWLSNEVEKDEIDATIGHELLHLTLAGIEHTVNLCWDGRRKMRKADAIRLLDDKIEEVIERLLKIL